MPMHPAETTKVPTTMHDRFNICHAHHSRTEERARVGGGSAERLVQYDGSTDESLALEAAVDIDR